MDTLSNAVARNPANYAVPAGEESIVPGLKVVAVTTAVATTAWVFSEAMRNEVQEVLQQCADEAEATVNARYRKQFTNEMPVPSEEDCRRLVPFGFNGTIEFQRKLGLEKHVEATQCVKLRLGEKYAGHLSIEQTYRVNLFTGKVEALSEAQVRELKAAGRKGELKGSIVPDLTFHDIGGFPVAAIYDFKFPCPPWGDASWHRYKQGSPHEGYDQGEIYNRLLGGIPRIIHPRPSGR